MIFTISFLKNLIHRLMGISRRYSQPFTYHLSLYFRVQASCSTPRVVPCSSQVRAHFSTPMTSSKEQAPFTAEVYGARVSMTLPSSQRRMVLTPNGGKGPTMDPVKRAVAETPKPYYILPFHQTLDLYLLLRVGEEMFTSLIGKAAQGKL